jgi:N-acetyltransferase 10
MLTDWSYRYAIGDTQADWSLAEAQVAQPGKSTVVSVKSTAVAGQKRKADGPAASSNTGGKEKKNRRSISKKAKH